MRNALLLAAVALYVAGPAVIVAEEPINQPAGIGVITAVRGNVFTARTGLPRPQAVRAHDAVLLQDAIETQPRSRVKALFDDDTLLTIGEDSRVEVIACETTADRRRLLVRLTRGDLRVLIGRHFTTVASVVEVLTPTAEVTANEAAFVVRADTGRRQGGLSAANELGGTDSAEIGTIVINVGAAGNVSFRSGGQRVWLNPGQRSMAPPRGSPSPPAIMLTAGGSSSGVPNKAVIDRLLRNTELPDQPKLESPQSVIRANGGADTRLTKPHRPSTDTAAQSAASQQSSLTPPAVISGAVEPAGSSSGGATLGQGTSSGQGSSILPPVIQSNSNPTSTTSGGSGKRSSRD